MKGDPVPRRQGRGMNTAAGAKIHAPHCSWHPCTALSFMHTPCARKHALVVREEETNNSWPKRVIAEALKIGAYVGNGDPLYPTQNDRGLGAATFSASATV